MDLNLIQQLITVVSRSAIGELEIERDGVSIRISKQAKASPLTPQSEQSSRSRQAMNFVVASDATPAVPSIGRHSIRAPLTGVFYRSTAENEPPLVSVGDVIEEGQKIGILEAMKTFNVVESDRAGTIVEITFEDRASVQSGDVLFVLEDVG